MARAKATKRKYHRRRPTKRGKYEKIARKVEEADPLSFSRWTARQVIAHLICAGRMRLVARELYEFPGYCRFPNHVFEQK